MIEALASQGIKPGTGATTVFMPAGALGLLPLGLAQTGTGRYLMDDYTIVLAPSLAALASARKRPPIPHNKATLAAVANPTSDLPFTNVETALVESHFANGRKLVVREKAATRFAVLEALKVKDYWHFSGHGSFNWDDPHASGLWLAGKEPLTIGHLVGAERQRAPRLVALSACESGLHDIATTPNEFIGLPAAFLQLGAHGVLATLGSSTIFPPRFWLPSFTTCIEVRPFFPQRRRCVRRKPGCARRTPRASATTRVPPWRMVGSRKRTYKCLTMRLTEHGD